MIPMTVVLVHRDDHERAQLRAALEGLHGVQIAANATTCGPGWRWRIRRDPAS